MPKTVIIAEAGVNHNGDINLAKKLIDAAAAAGADYVKFQTFKADKLVAKEAKMADYQKNNLGTGDMTQYQMLKKLELSDESHDELIAYCNEKGIAFLSSPFDEESILLLQQKGIQLGKIPSGEVTNLPYLRTMAKAFPQLVLSTGMCTMEDVTNAVNVLKEAGAGNITVLHCNTEYPTPMQDVNLKAMLHIKQELDLAIGYSDHTEGIEVPIAAVALGAVMIEKHFTLDRNMEGPDHKASLQPQELAAMVSAIRNIEKAISGSGIKEPSASEAKNIHIARKSIVAKRDIKKGETFTAENTTAKRPGDGLSPMLWDKVIGQTAAKDFPADTFITLEA